jgi:hypothetical protein
MAMLAPPIPRMKPMLTQSQAPQQPQAAPEPFVWGADGTKMTPADVARRKQIAAELAKSAGDTSPIQHWTQGLGRIADGVLGALEQRRANEAETEGRAHFKDQLAQLLAAQGAPGADMNALRPQAAAAYSDPYADEGSKMMLAPQFTQPEKTDDQREYEAAKAGGFGGSFMDYMQALKTPVFQAPAGYAVSPDSTAGAPKVVRAEGLPADPAAAPKPQVQKAEDEDIAAVQGVHSINAQLDGIDGMIAGGKLDLGFFNNLGARAQNFAGASTENSTNYATMMSTLEKMRNDSLRLNSGVQTEGDAVRAWNELVSNVNDPHVVRAQIARIKVLNERAAAQRLQLINIRRQRNNMESFDPEAVALPGGAPTQQPAPQSGGQGGWKIERVQ